MSISSDELNAFHQFAQAHLANDDAESLRELVDLWEIEHPTPELRAHDFAAVQAAIRDMENGDIGRPATEVLREIRSELAIRRDP